ncbi:hypothetical protein ACFRQM_04390 [Streptomyces sp. NPDC056831]|uniref:hypothetical protein n=1 Tax=Streptomyces sp. NPDC056831 TaxID=3345954 RepID=UPI0036C8400B
MNRNTKHPGRTYKRKAATGDRTRGGRTWRITASWDARPDRPAVRTTSDRKARDRMADEFAAQGGYVVVEEARGFQWRTMREINGAEQLLADRRAEQEQREAEEREKRHRADYEAQAEQNALAATIETEAELDHLARLMRRPPIARAATGQTTARHMTGAQR